MSSRLQLMLQYFFFKVCNCEYIHISKHTFFLPSVYSWFMFLVSVSLSQICIIINHTCQRCISFSKTVLKDSWICFVNVQYCIQSQLMCQLMGPLSLMGEFIWRVVVEKHLDLRLATEYFA